MFAMLMQQLNPIAPRQTHPASVRRALTSMTCHRRVAACFFNSNALVERYAKEIVHKKGVVMRNNLAEEIAAKAAALPVEKQREVLAFIDSLIARERESTQGIKPFRSVLGMLQGQGNLDNLERDIAEMRQEALKNFPREEPQHE